MFGLFFLNSEFVKLPKIIKTQQNVSVDVYDGTGDWKGTQPTNQPAYSVCGWQYNTKIGMLYIQVDNASTNGYSAIPINIITEMQY